MQPLNLSGQFDPQSINTSVGGKAGINILTAPELTSNNFVLDNKGYKIEEEGALIKLKGVLEEFTVAGGNPITMLERQENDLWWYTYSTKVAIHDDTADTETIVKSDFTNSDPFSGVRDGDYFFLCNGGDKIGRISRTLDYDGQTGNFAVGLVVTGGTSGATAIILEDSDGGAAGTLTLGDISGTFQDDEALTDSATGAAVVDGTLGYTFTSISDAPYAKVLAKIGTRLHAGNLSGDIVGSKKGNSQTVVWAEEDSGSNPPHTNWTTATSPPETDDPASLRFRRAGAVKDIVPLGAQTVSYHEAGKAGFRLDTIDLSGTGLVQKTITDFQKQDLGALKAVETPVGNFYINKSGLWRQVSGGSTSQQYSTNDINVSRFFLTDDLLADLNFDDVDMVFFEDFNWVLVTCRKNSSFDNYVFWYNVENGSFGTIPDWEINRFMPIGSTLYGGSSLTTTVYKLFDGYEVNGAATTTFYKQEVDIPGGVDDLHDLLGFTIKGRLHPSTTINISFDIYDKSETLIENYKQYTWTASGGVKAVEGFNDGGFNDLGFNGSGADDELIDVRGYKRTKTDKFKRIIVKLSSEDRFPHEITYFMLNVTNRGKNKKSQNIT